MTQEASFYFGQIRSRIRDDISSVLRDVDPRLAPPRSANPVLGEIPDIAFLVQRAQREGVPVWKCSGANQRTKTAIEESFARIAARLVEESENVAPDGH